MAYYNPYYEYAKTAPDPHEAGHTGTAQPQPTVAQKPDYTNAILGGVSALTQSFSQPSGAPDDFSVDPNAGYKGSLSGLASGGVVGAIVGGIGGQVSTFRKVHENLGNLDYGVNVTQTDALGRPMYDGSAINKAQGNISALGEGEKKIKRSLDPATHAISGIFGTKRKIRNARKKLIRGIQSAQRDYTAKAEDYNAQQLAMEQYNQLLNNKTRYNNLYSIGTNLY